MTSLIERFISQTQHLSVLVVGETIVDEFIKVNYEGQSMKSFCPVFRLTDGATNIQQGGAQAIANHLVDFVKSIKVITNTNNEIVKTRYIDAGDSKKHVEINKFDTTSFNKQININTADYDVVIIADFGHGFCDQIVINDGFHLMCQTNSNNFGFNRISKWKTYRKKSACIDLREASLQINKRISKPNDEHVLEIYNYELNCDDLFVTTGKSGSVCTNGKTVNRIASYKTEIVDTIGAGDTYFAFASLASHLNLEGNDKLIVQSLAASLSTTWLCNEKSVTKESLLSHAAKYL